jgi:hypothetical protein
MECFFNLIIDLDSPENLVEVDVFYFSKNALYFFLNKKKQKNSYHFAGTVLKKSLSQPKRVRNSEIKLHYFSSHFTYNFVFKSQKRDFAKRSLKRHAN